MYTDTTKKLSTQIELALINEAKVMGSDERKQYKDKIKHLLKQEDAVLVAHYYTDPILQELAEETGGCVSDSLEMARFGHQHAASTLVLAGVRFMGETAKILTPKKRILMPTLEATCSLDLGCPIETFGPYCDAHPDHKVVVYANTSAAVKARADWVVTSSIALDVVDHLQAEGHKILWGPDKHLGAFVQKETGAEMLIWNSACIVHEEFKSKAIYDLKKIYPNAGVLVHPESPAEVIDIADAVGSTSQLIQSAQDLPHKMFIVATDRGIFYKMHQIAPHKTFIDAPTSGNGATCISCAHCPWMAMNGLENVMECLEKGGNEVFVHPDLGKKAMISLQRMLDFSMDNKKNFKGNA